jgi:hypothetical protein
VQLAATIMNKTRTHADDKQAVAPKIDVKKLDPVRGPSGSTTDEDISRADNEGMAPVPVPQPSVAPKTP